MIVHGKNKGRPRKRAALINERKKRTFTNEKGITKTWTQQYLADQIELQFGKKITIQAISQIERGKNNPRLEVLDMLSKIYQKPVEYLLG